jgi:hypothetical protein
VYGNESLTVKNTKLTNELLKARLVESLNLPTKFKALSSKDSGRRSEVRDKEETTVGSYSLK